MREARSKIVSLDELREALGDPRRNHKTVVFSNGCFDTLHVGHVRYLEGAKREGDILVTAINADSSVKHLKGADRPVLDQQARALLVAALRCVDYVIIFSEPNVERLLEEIRPAVHAKGTDYTIGSVPERATAERLGIRVVIVGDPKTHSTASLLKAIRKEPNA
jgi:rfaE bifunctional protein nucleotidyltransferase chain/domain